MVQERIQLTQEQNELIQRFITCYNAIDKELKHRLGVDQYESFARVVDAYGDKNQYWAYKNELKTIGELRNFLVHKQTAPKQHLAVPTADVVMRVETIFAHLSERVTPKYQRPVTTMQASQSLADMLTLISQREYSQFPVYDENEKLMGLITENGITRWLAHHVTVRLTLVEFQDVTIGEVLQSEEYRINYQLISRNDSVDEAFAHFARNPLLEAVLITDAGKKEQKLLGIITRWDVLVHSNDPNK
jgi:predicted transcriptional regulator